MSCDVCGLEHGLVYFVPEAMAWVCAPCAEMAEELDTEPSWEEEDAPVEGAPVLCAGGAP